MLRFAAAIVVGLFLGATVRVALDAGADFLHSSDPFTIRFAALAVLVLAAVAVGLVALLIRLVR